MTLFGKRKEQMEHELSRAERLLIKAKSLGIDTLSFKNTFDNARSAIDRNKWETAEKIIENVTNQLNNEITHQERIMNQRETEKQYIQSLISTIESYLKELRKHGIDPRIQLFEDVKTACESGAHVDVKNALERIVSMFNHPIYKPEKSWKYSLREKISKTTVHDEFYIVGSSDKSVYCLDPQGNLRWKQRIGDLVTSFAHLWNWLLIGSKDKSIYCLDMNGTIVWKYETGGVVRDIEGYGDLIVAASADKHVYCLDTQGSLFWKYKTGGSVNSLTIFRDLVIAGSEDGMVYCIEHNGALRWKQKTDAGITLVMSLRNSIISGCGNNTVYCADANGNLEWKQAFEQELLFLNVHENQLYVGLRDKSLQCITMNGLEKWNAVLNDEIVSFTFIDDLILVGTSDKYLNCFDESGELLWKQWIGATPRSVHVNPSTIFVHFGSNIHTFSTSIIPVFISIQQQILAGRIQFTNIFEAEQLYDLAKELFESIELEKAGRLLNRVKGILDEHQQRIKRLVKDFSVHKPDYTTFDKILETEYRENVVNGITSAQKTIMDIQSILTTLLGKRANIDSILLKQKTDNAINALIEDYRTKLGRAKERDKISVAKSYAFMVVNQSRKLQMKEKMRTIIAGIDEQIKELSDFSKDLYENANEMPNDADLVGAFGILNNEAAHAISDANKLIGDIREVEAEITKMAVVKELSMEQEELVIDDLHADVKAEIEKELGGCE